MNKNAYIYYSGATDITGKKLQEALDIDGGSVKPKGKKLVIGWGAKTKKNTNIDGAVLNHPDKIKDNRNKFSTLQKLNAAGANVAKFINAEGTIAALAAGNLSLPLVGRRNYHQGGKGFWLCVTKSQVENAIKEGAQYFQEFIDIKDEFRVHVFTNEVLYAQKKVKRDNMTEAFVDQNKEKIEALAGKNNKNLDADTMDYVLNNLGKKQETPDMIIRSNTRGWKFAHVKTTSTAMKDECFKALDSIGLEFGAVDCCTDQTGKVWILEVNSGPGLKKTVFDIYVTRFKKSIDEIFNPPKPKAKAKDTAAAKKTTKPPKKAAAGVAGAGTGNTLTTKLELMHEMAEKADGDESKALESVFAKMFGE